MNRMVRLNNKGDSIVMMGGCGVAFGFCHEKD